VKLSHRYVGCGKSETFWQRLSEADHRAGMKIIEHYQVHHSDVRCPRCGKAGMERVVWEYNTGVLRRVRECPVCCWADIKENLRAEVIPPENPDELAALLAEDDDE
jgi:hypothetical protein